MIDREDMLELTRRMTVARSNFTRIAGVYYDEEGYVDGTFNTNFLNLSSSDKTKNLELAKAVLFSKTNEELKEIEIPSSARGKDKMITLLDAVCSENLKNDALMEIFYEIFGEQIPFETTFAIYIFRGSYDIPIKGTDNESEWESEEVYDYLIASIFQVDEDYEPSEPICGFLYPAFKERSKDLNHVLIFDKSGKDYSENIKLALNLQC